MKSNKQGFVAIEAIISMSTLLIMFVMCVGFYVYMVPKITLEKEVHLLGQKAKIQGGLTYDDVTIFKNNLAKKGYDKNKIQVTATTLDGPGTTGGQNAIGVDALNKADASVYISRTQLTPIEISVVAPANIKLLNGPLSHFFINSSVNKNYYLKETVLSERW